VATLLASIRVRAGSERQFEDIARRLFKATHAAESSVRRYEYWRGAEQGMYYALESFDDYAGFIAHETSPHHLAALPELREVLQDVRLEWIDPVAGASTLKPTDRPDVADDLAARHGLDDRYRVTIQDWWLSLRAAGDERDSQWRQGRP